MNQTWVNWIESQHSGGLKVSTLGTHTIQNLDPALAAQYGVAVLANPTFWIFDDNLTLPAEKITPSLQDLANIQSKVESEVGSFFT
jgi:hypothetical protein